MDFLLFIIYNMYYKDGNYKNDRPAVTVFFQFSTCINGLIWGFVNIFYWYNKGSCYNYTTLSRGIISLICSAMITYFLFFYKNRFKEIHEKYQNNNSARLFLIRFLAILFMFCMLFFSLIVTYFKRKYDLCPFYQ